MEAELKQNGGLATRDYPSPSLQLSCSPSTWTALHSAVRSYTAPSPAEPTTTSDRTTVLHTVGLPCSKWGWEFSEGRTGHSHSLPIPSPHTTQPQVVLAQPQQPIVATQQTLTRPAELSTKLPKYAFVISMVGTFIFAVLCWLPGLLCLVPATVMSIVVSSTHSHTHTYTAHNTRCR